jgi:hypothetical protein
MYDPWQNRMRVKQVHHEGLLGDDLLQVEDNIVALPCQSWDGQESVEQFTQLPMGSTLWLAWRHRDAGVVIMVQEEPHLVGAPQMGLRVFVFCHAQLQSTLKFRFHIKTPGPRSAPITTCVYTTARVIQYLSWYSIVLVVQYSSQSCTPLPQRIQKEAPPNNPNQHPQPTIRT